MRAKVVLVGAAHSGKTSVIRRYIEGEFTPRTAPTTQPTFFKKTVCGFGLEVNLEIWDTAGQEQYHALSPMFYRDADVGVVVFDLTDPTSFTKTQQWVSELRQARGSGISIIVAGNKCDLPSQRAITLEAMTTFAASIGTEAFETSARTGENVNLLFEAVAKVAARRRKGKSESVPSGGRRSTVKLNETPLEESGCC